MSAMIYFCFLVSRSARSFCITYITGNFIAAWVASWRLGIMREFVMGGVQNSFHFMIWDGGMSQKCLDPIYKGVLDCDVSLGMR